MKKFRFNSVTSITFKIIKGFFLFINNIKITDLIMMYFFGVFSSLFFSKMPKHVQDMGGGGESYSNCFELQKFSSNIFNDARYFLYLHTCVCVRPRDAASSARSGRAKYCVRWKRLFSCCNCRLEYIVLGFLIFLPFPLIRSSSIWDLSAKKKINYKRMESWPRVLYFKKTHERYTIISDRSLFKPRFQHIAN